MPLSTHELEELKVRVQQAQYRGYTLGKAHEYVAALGGGAPPVGVEAGSPEHVLHLIESYGGTPVPVQAEPVAVPVEPAPALMSAKQQKKADRKAEIPPPPPEPVKVEEAVKVEEVVATEEKPVV